MIYYLLEQTSSSGKWFRTIYAFAVRVSRKLSSMLFEHAQLPRMSGGMRGHAPKNAGLSLFLLFFYLRSSCTVFLRKRWSLWSLLLGPFGLEETLSFFKGNYGTLLKCLKGS
jgi:hypothetical protein